MKTASLAVILVALGAAACSKESARDPLPDLNGSGGRAGSGGSAPNTGGQSSGGTGGSDQPGSGGTGTGGAGGAGGEGGEAPADTEVVDVPASACEPLDLSGALVLDSGQNNPAFDRLGRVGSRYYALASESLALITFDADGTGLSTFLNGVVGVAPGPSGLNVLFDDTNELLLQRYDETLTPVGETFLLGPGAAKAVSISASETHVLAVWGETEALQGQLIEGDSGVEVVTPEPLLSVARCQSAAIPSGEGFSLAWSCLGSVTQISSAQIAADGAASVPQVLFRSPEPLDLEQYVATAEGGLLLFTAGSDQATWLARTDAAGSLVGPVRRLHGASGLALAVRPDGVGLIASAGEQTVFRVLETDGTPKTGWKCLDDVSPGGYGAVTTTEGGYAALVRHANGSAWLVELDGSGAPVQ